MNLELVLDHYLVHAFVWGLFFRETSSNRWPKRVSRVLWDEKYNFPKKLFPFILQVNTEPWECVHNFITKITAKSLWSSVEISWKSLLTNLHLHLSRDSHYSCLWWKENVAPKGWYQLFVFFQFFPLDLSPMWYCCNIDLDTCAARTNIFLASIIVYLIYS